MATARSEASEAPDQAAAKVRPDPAGVLLAVKDVTRYLHGRFILEPLEKGLFSPKPFRALSEKNDSTVPLYGLDGRDYGFLALYKIAVVRGSPHGGDDNVGLFPAHLVDPFAR